MISRSRIRRLDGVRSQVSAAEGHLVDELLAGRLGRREFLRRATVLGMAIPLSGGILAACAGPVPGEAPAGAPAAPQKAGGTLRNAVNTPTAAINPTKVADNGGLVAMAQTGEYLAYTDSSTGLRPVLAERWSADATGKVWTFDIRQGVTFHNGAPMTAADVAATIDRLADPANGSNALSVFKGVLGKGGTVAKGNQVVFTLDRPNVNFPYLVSSQNYNAIILPASYDPTQYTKDFLGTGPYKFDSYTPGVGAAFVKNPTYWDTTRPPFLDRIELKFYTDVPPQIVALQGNEVDVVSGISFASGRGLFTDPNFTPLYVPSSYTRQLSMRCDQAPFTDARVRMALALALDRPAALKGLLDDKGDLGNDSPFGPTQPATDTTEPQRAQDLAQAKQLLAAAGQAQGLTATLALPRVQEMPDLAVTLQNAAKDIGVTLTLDVKAANDYYGDAAFGSSPWLDSTLSLCDYGHRSVPDVIANAALRSDGVWNAAHYKSTTYDALFDDYTSQLDVAKQKEAVGKMQRLLLADTPMIVPYFLNWLGATKKGVQGVNLNPTGQLDLSRASIA